MNRGKLTFPENMSTRKISIKIDGLWNWTVAQIVMKIIMKNWDKKLWILTLERILGKTEFITNARIDGVIFVIRQ